MGSTRGHPAPPYHGGKVSDSEGTVSDAGQAQLRAPVTRDLLVHFCISTETLFVTLRNTLVGNRGGEYKKVASHHRVLMLGAIELHRHTF
jgi:hypothetical protein